MQNALLTGALALADSREYNDCKNSKTARRKVNKSSASADRGDQVELQ